MNEDVKELFSREDIAVVNELLRLVSQELMNELKKCKIVIVL
jgi:hypothetical protein